VADAEIVRGPWADGPPPEALVVDAPPLDQLTWADRLRVPYVGAAIAVFVVFEVVRWPFRRRGRSVRSAAADGLVDAFIHLGPTYVKLGQLIASSPGVVPVWLADACLRTLDEVPPFDGATARQIVEEDLGHPISTLFATFDEQPLAAASVGQVHACTMPDGREVVVKLQRPGIAGRMLSDLRVLHVVCKLLDRTKQGRAANVMGVVRDLHKVTTQELNVGLEASRQARFRAGIGAFGDNETVTAPEVIWERCGPRTICMERLRGVPMDHFDEIAARGVDGELLLRRGIKVWVEAALVHGPFHGDVHAGNLWLLDDGRSSYLDFGIMGELTPEWRSVLRDVFTTAMIDGDYVRVVHAYQRVGVLPPELDDVEQVALMVKTAVEPLLDQSIGEVSLGQTFQQNLDLAQSLGAKNPDELVLISKQLLYFERYAKGLAPDYVLARDLYLLKNVLPEAVAQAAAERGLTLPD
jgi:predicted unusual protein kinase regulating ubiquinone biosynthesis (AarF/ABC1/UbiB family)